MPKKRHIKKVEKKQAGGYLVGPSHEEGGIPVGAGIEDGPRGGHPQAQKRHMDSSTTGEEAAGGGNVEGGDLLQAR